MPEASGTRAASDGAPPIPNLILTQDDASAAEWRTLLDPAGIVTAPEPVVDADDDFVEGADADALPEPGEDTPAFLPGEEELEALLESTADMDDEA